MAEEIYLDLFFELELLRVYQNRGTPSTVIDSLYEQIFKEYDADTALFKSTHQYFQTQISEQQIRTDSVIARIEREVVRFDMLDSLKAQEKSIKE